MLTAKEVVPESPVIEDVGPDLRGSRNAVSGAGGRRILSLSSVYPNPSEPGLGGFVRSRLHHMARSAEIKIVAPIPMLDYSNPNGNVVRRREFAGQRWDGGIEVFHPRWIYPPLGTPANILLQFARLLPLVRRIQRDFDFDLIDAHFCYPEGVVAAMLAASLNKPFTITLRGSEMSFDRSLPRRAAMSWAMRRAARVIAVSEELRQYAISHGASANRVVTIPNGIDRDIFRIRENDGTKNPERARKVILTVGELIEAKGHHVIVQALEKLVASGTDAELWIAGGTSRGGPKFEGTLRKMVSSRGLSGRVKFLGWVDRVELASILASVDVFCLASFTEGSPNVVYEALACGTPVVATAVGDVSAMIPSDRYGEVVPAQDSVALELALGRALSRSWDREAISTWGRKRDWDQVAREVLDCFETAITGAARPVATGALSNCAGAGQ